MPTIDEEVSLELEYATNRCRMELVSLQAQYYTFIIKSLYMTYLKQYEDIESFSKKELLEMLEYLEEVVGVVETESMIDGTQKYDVRESLPFIQECIHRVMDRYGFKDWVIE